MLAMQLKKIREKLQQVDLPIPKPQANEVLIKVGACGICRTDLHVIDGELPHPYLPIIPGHQIVGTVISLGKQVDRFEVGQCIGVPWLGSSCGACDYCHQGQENLCDNALYTGYQLNGGFAEYCLANADFCFAIPSECPDIQAAPLLCAGLIGYRALRKTDNAKRIGLYGFGAAAHLVAQVACYQQREVYAFTRPGDIAAITLARQLGAIWASGSDEATPTLRCRYYFCTCWGVSTFSIRCC